MSVKKSEKEKKVKVKKAEPKYLCSDLKIIETGNCNCKFCA